MNFAKVSFWITLLLLVGYIIAFFKEGLIANYFGISERVDAYNIAIQIPVIIFSFVAVAIKSVAIPIYSDIFYKKGFQEANLFANSFISLNIIIAFFILVLGELSSDIIIYLFAPGFNKETHDIAVNLLRITFPTIIFTVVIDVVTGILNIHKKLISPCFAVYFLQLSIIIITITFHLKWGITSACIGQVLGSFLQMVYLYLIAMKVYHFNFSTHFKSQEIKLALKMSGPVIWGISIAEINAMINRMVCSFLFVGSISALSYAGKLNSIFLTFCIQAISIIIFPLFAESTAKGNLKQLCLRINYTLTIYTTILLPMTGLIICLREEVVEIAFARGAFQQDAVQLTKNVLGCYLVGMLFMAFRDTLTKVFYSLKDTKSVAKNATIGVILNIILNLSLPWLWGVEGIALGSSISAIFISIRLLWLLLRKEKDIHINYFNRNLSTIFLSTIIMSLLIFIVRYLFLPYIPIVRFIICSLIAFIIYLSLLYLIKPPIVSELISYIRSRI